MTRLDPRTKLALGFMALAAVLIAREPLTLIVECAAVLLAVAMSGLVSKMIGSLRLAGSMLVLVFITGAIFFDLPTALVLSIRLLTLLTVSFFFFCFIDPQEVGDVLHKMGLPYAVSFIFATSMRYVPMLTRKVRQIRAAQQARGIDLRPRIKNIPNLVALLTPLLIQSFLLADELALAMESRGFGRKQRSSRRVYRLTLKEYGLMGLGLALLVALIWWESGS